MRVSWFEATLDDETALIEQRFFSRSYRFTHYKERLIFRGANRNPRQISIPTVRDRLALRALCKVLHLFAPKTRGEAPHTIIRQVVEAIRAGDHNSKVFVRIDVKDFFPNVTHPILDRELRRFGLTENVRALCMAAVKTGTGDKGSLSKRGVPQGLSVSGALAALYMIKFDEGQLAQGRAYFRYVDDILFICNESDAAGLLEEIARNLKARGLSIHPRGVAGKTEISAVANGIDYLGYSVCINKVSIRKSSYKRMFQNILKVITNYKYGKSIDRLTFRLNVKITGCMIDGGRRGWMMFFSYTEDTSQLAFLDRFVQNQLKRVDFSVGRVSEIKRFVKSYHEIRHNLAATTYIPNFDSFDLEQKKEVVSSMSLIDISNWSADSIEAEFERIVSREVRDLERDVGNIS